jgi:hypothetical protein
MLVRSYSSARQVPDGEMASGGKAASGSKVAQCTYIDIHFFSGKGCLPPLKCPADREASEDETEISISES